MMLIAGSAFAQNPPTTPTNVATLATNNDTNANFWLREEWVPASDLAPALARYPRAVPLSRDQLLTLLHDAHAADPAATDPAHAPPERAVLRQARFEGRLLAGPDGHPQASVEGTLEVEAFSDAWADVPLGLPGVALGTAELDDAAGSLGRASLRRSGQGTGSPARLQLQGRGVHRLRVGFVLPVGTDAAGSFVDVPQADGAGEFVLLLPAGTLADSPRGCAVQMEDGGVAARVPLGRGAPGKPFTLSNDIGDFTKLGHLDAKAAPPSVATTPAPDRLHWRTPPPTPPEAGALLQEGAGSVVVEAARVTVAQAVVVRPALGRLPAEVRLVLPAGARAVRVENAAGRWSVGADGLRVRLDPAGGNAPGGAAAFGVLYDLPLTLDPQGSVTPVGVPWLEVVGAHRVTGQVFVTPGAGVQVRRVEPGAVATAADRRGVKENAVAVFNVADLPAPDAPLPPTALTLDARRTTARFDVDADVQADFQLDGVHIQRTLVFHVEEGELFTARVRLPAGEALLSVHSAANDPVPDWRQEGDELVFAWNAGLTESSKTVLTLGTRADLAPPKPGAPTAFTLGAALVPGAERLTGYVALDSIPALRLVTTGGEDRLERRDGRTTPVRGSVAWFYRENFALALQVERREAQTEARFTGYALPLAGAVEIHGQIDFHFLFSGVEEVKIRVPTESADAFFFTGNHIAERRRDGNVWTIRFQGEQTGDLALGVQATIPAPADKDDPQRFHFRLPAVVPLDGARWSGAWAVEANTDTEIRFATTGANEADALHAPPLAGYQPTRRVIGVFEFAGGGADPAIEMDGVRHPAASVAAAVVDRLDLETFAATSGVARHRATLRARMAGDGFFNVRLPAGATLWSLTRDGQPVKPVGGNGSADGEVRIELPGGRDPAHASTVAVIYETPGAPWTAAGSWKAFAPTFDSGVPVVRSGWKLHLPDGFDYQFPEMPHGAAPVAAKVEDLLIPRLGMAAGELVLLPLPVFNSVQVRGRIAQQRALEHEVQMEKEEAAQAAPDAAAPPPADLAPKFNDRVQQIKDLLLQAQGFYDSGRYDLAFKRYEQVLALDPYNNAARKGEERVDLVKARHGDPYSYDETRGSDWQHPVNEWGLPVRKNGLEVDPRNGNAKRAEGSQGVAAIQRKLASIIIPRIDFHATTLSDAIEFLRQESRRLDTDPDVDARGVNIFLKLPPRPAADAAAPTPGPTPSEVAIPGLPTPMPPPPPMTFPTANTRITLTLGHIPLLEALKYVASQAGLKVKVEPYAVSIVPVSEQTDVLATEEFKVPPNFISNAPSGGIGSSALNQAAISTQDGGATDITGQGTVQISRQDAKTFLEASGVTFPPGASATYLPATGKLVVRNTQENLDLIDSLRAENQKVFPPQGTPPQPGNRSGDFGISANAIDALLYGSAAANAPHGIYSMAGVFTDPQFQTLLEHGDQREAGLLPLKLDLPENGQVFTFEGGGAPGAVEFRYTDWRVTARGRWIALALGGLGFLLFAAGWAHPWRRTFLAAVALTFFPLIAAPSAVGTCNALLAGWLLAVLGWCVTRFLLRQRRAPLAAVAAVALCLAAMLAPSHVSAADAPPDATPGPSPETVIVPYDATRPVTDQKPPRYYLPYERFLLLWDAAKQHRRPPVPEPPPGGEPFTLSTARYDARLAGDILEITATLELQTSGDAWVGVPLDFNGLDVAGVTLDGAPAALSGDARLWIGAAGAHRVEIALRRRVANVVPGATHAWTVPPTAATLLTLTLPPGNPLRAEVHGDTPGGAVEETTPDGGRRLTASLGGTRNVTLIFRDAPAPVAAPSAAGSPALARVTAWLVAGARAETVRAEVNFAFSGGARDHFRVLFDPGLTLTNLDAPGVKEWHLARDGSRQTLDLTLDAPAHDAYRLTLEADRAPVTALPAGRRTFPLVSADARRVEEIDALRADDGVELTLPDGPPPRVRRVNDPPFDRGRAFAAFAGDGFAEIAYNVHSANEKRTAHIDYLYQVGHGKIDLAASARLVQPPGGAPILTADLQLPPGFAVQAVAGHAVWQWWRDGDVLSLRFAPARDDPEIPLVVYLVRQFDRAPDRFPLQPLVAKGFAETDGQVVVAADRALTVGLSFPTGVRASDLSEIDPETAAAEFQVKPPLERQQAFHYRGETFEVQATLETQPARWESQWVTRATVQDGVVALETHVNVATHQGAVDAVEFTLPARLPEARVSGPDVRETLTVAQDKDRKTYRVLFQNPVYADGELSFIVSGELPLGADRSAALPDLAFPESGGGRSAGGFLLVENASDGEMTLAPYRLDPAIEKDVPFLPPQIVAGTRFFRAAPDAPWSLGVRVAELEKTAGRAALVAYAELTSTLRAGGEEWHRAVYHLQNRSLQFLPVQLPGGMEFIGARVAGESVRVDQEGKAEGGRRKAEGNAQTLLVPLLKTRPGELSYDVEVVYRHPAPGVPGERPRAPWFEHWQLDEPILLDVPIEKTLWDVWLPTDARLWSRGGNVAPVIADLNETEKLESALDDLRSLSATLGSGRASTAERQRALSNFNSLAATVSRQAQVPAPSSRSFLWNAAETPVLKSAEATRQSGEVFEKKRAIQNEIDSLSAANTRVQQAPPTQPPASDFRLSRRGVDAPGFDGFSNYGSPITRSASQAGVDVPVFNEWRDTRASTQQQTPSTTVTAGGTVLAQAAQRAESSKGELALNDSLAVELPVARDEDIQDQRYSLSGATSITLDQNRLSTARAAEGVSVPASAPAVPALPMPAADASGVGVDALRKPSSPAAPPAAEPPELRSESLRAVGRISLAVDFPREGQVFHFQKLKADARLTLVTAQPERFAPWRWLGMLVTGLAAAWVADQYVRRRLARRRERREAAARRGVPR